MIDLNGIKVKNPFFVAAGPFKYGRGYEIYENPFNWLCFHLGLINPEIFGGVVTKTITCDPRKGNYIWYKPWQVLRPVSGGWLNRFGWNNCGIKKFRDDITLKKVNLDNLIPSLGALKTVREFLIMVAMLNKIKLLAIELNISSPNAKIVFRNDLNLLENFFKQIVEMSKHPLIVKLGATDKPMAKAKIAEKCGINAISAINTMPKDIPGFGHCGLSGKAIKSIALETVYRLAKTVRIPIIGGGGIYSQKDCEDFFQAGAKGVSFCSVFLTRPKIPGMIVRKYVS